MLTSNDLAYMRSSINELLPDTCNILSLGWSSDGQGGVVEAWGTLTASVACRVDYGQGREVISGGALNQYQKAIVSMAYDVVITPANRIEVGTNIFSIQAINNGQSWQGVTRCSCELI
jgi:head-tail adaptor